jgi:serine/threonine protein kinase
VDFGCGSTFYLSPECQGGLFERLQSYSTETNDIWALGVILVNLTCGRNPWRQACPSDETFRAYVHNPEFLRTILPISHATNRILKGLFALEPVERMSLRELRRQVLALDTFTMTDDELRTAHSAARAAAAASRRRVPSDNPPSFGIDDAILSAIDFSPPIATPGLAAAGRSSSSIDTMLPPTPEFNPADKVVPSIDPKQMGIFHVDPVDLTI